MAKTTKQTSTGAGEFGAEPVKKKTASRKVAAKKVGSKFPGSTKTASSEKAAARKASTESAPAKKAGSTVKAATKNSVARKTLTKKAAPMKRVTAGAVVNRQISSAERRRMIAEAAYLRGESQGFLSDEQEDWLLAEAAVDSLLVKADVTVSD